MTPEELVTLQELVDALPEELRSSQTVFASDFFEYRLGRWTGTEWRTVVLDDGTAKGAAGSLIEFLRHL